MSDGGGEGGIVGDQAFDPTLLGGAPPAVGVSEGVGFDPDALPPPAGGDPFAGGAPDAEVFRTHPSGLRGL